MKNLALYVSMMQVYKAISAADAYILGFTYHNNVYFVVVDDNVLELACSLDKASRGAGYSIRFKPTNAVKEMLFTLYSPKMLCSVEYFNTICSDSKYNKGEIFEKLITEFFGQVWKKDNIPFTVAGDININGKEYQIKFEKATLVSEKTLTRAAR